MLILIHYNSECFHLFPDIFYLSNSSMFDRPWTNIYAGNFSCNKLLFNMWNTFDRSMNIVRIWNPLSKPNFHWCNMLNRQCLVLYFFPNRVTYFENLRSMYSQVWFWSNFSKIYANKLIDLLPFLLFSNC